VEARGVALAKWPRILVRVTIVTLVLGDHVLGLTELQALRLVEGLAAIRAAESRASQALAIRITDAVRHRDPARGTVEHELSLTEEEQQVLLLALERFDWDRTWETAFMNVRAALREEGVPRPIAGKRP
jgi:hypothetical protein